MFWSFRAPLLLVLLLASVPRLTQADEQPASAITPQQIDDAIRQLGDRDFRVREQATRTLWAAGSAAEAALRRALDHGDPEIARRARTILSNIGYGITPDMSDEVIELMSRYRTGDAAVKRHAAGTLAQRGATGARVLLKLREEEDDPAIRSVISSTLLRSSRDLAVSLIADGDASTARRLLAATAEAGDERAAMNYAAFLLVHGGLDRAIAEMQARLNSGKAADASAEPSIANTALALTFLHRANGDLPAAKEAAELSRFEPLLWNILVEIGDWKELARRAVSSAGASAERGSLEILCFGAAFHRLSGDEAGVDKFAALLQQAADRQPDASWHAAEGLLLNGRVDLGIDVLTRHDDLVTAFDFQVQRLAFDELPRLMERARANESTAMGELEVKAARASWFTGDPQAAAALDAAEKQCEKRRNLDGLIAAIGAAVEMGLSERARWYTIDAMEVSKVLPRAGVASDTGFRFRELFEQARFRDASRAAGWWQIFRQRFPKDPAGVTLEKLRQIDERQMKPEDLRALCDVSAADAKRRPAEYREVQLELIADTLAAAGQRPAAIERYTELARMSEQTNPSRSAGAICKIAAFDVDAGQWRAAAERYLQAWSRERSNPVPLYLSGWALAKAGDASIGTERMQRAHLIPLSDENRRHDLYEALIERKLTKEANRERDVILRTADFLSWRRSEALRRAGDEAHAAGDAARAADLWERAFLDNNSEATRFVEPWANVSMPALIRRTRAVALIRAGNISMGVKHADACMEMSPGDADALIDIVTALDATGHKSDAEALYRRNASRYLKLCETYPQSGSLHNLYAWAAAKCRRDLDAALTHARRAVELQPTNTAGLDTLAETHFQRGEIQQAVVVMQKCAELEPAEPRHKEQLERFRKALASGAGKATVTPTRPAPP